MRIAFITDAWHPQTNGVVTTISHLYEEISNDFEVHIIHPEMFEKVPLSIYPEISLAVPTGLWKLLDDISPNYIHIFTEGPLGLAAKSYCLKNSFNHTTSFHTNFPLLLNQLLYVPEYVSWEMTRIFHATSSKVLVTNEGMREVLLEKGFVDNFVVWSRGIDRRNFFYQPKKESKSDLFKALCVSRISKEKNLGDFCKLSYDDEIEATLVGDGPKKEKYQKKYPNLILPGKVSQSELKKYYYSADVFFFPSRFDTFGVVMIEAMACGLPVVAYNEVAPKALIENGVNGYLIDKFSDTTEAFEAVARLDRKKVHETSLQYTWDNVATIFTKSLVKV